MLSLASKNRACCSRLFVQQLLANQLTLKEEDVSQFISTWIQNRGPMNYTQYALRSEDSLDVDLLLSLPERIRHNTELRLPQSYITSVLCATFALLAEQEGTCTTAVYTCDCGAPTTNIIAADKLQQRATSLLARACARGFQQEVVASWLSVALHTSLTSTSTSQLSSLRIPAIVLMNALMLQSDPQQSMHRGFMTIAWVLQFVQAAIANSSHLTMCNSLLHVLSSHAQISTNMNTHANWKHDSNNNNKNDGNCITTTPSSSSYLRYLWYMMLGCQHISSLPSIIQQALQYTLITGQTYTTPHTPMHSGYPPLPSDMLHGLIGYLLLSSQCHNDTKTDQATRSDISITTIDTLHVLRLLPVHSWLLSAWGDASYYAHTDASQDASLSRAIEIAISYLSEDAFHQASADDGSPLLLSTVMQSVQSRLDYPHTAVRGGALRVASAMSQVITPNAPLRFSGDKDVDDTYDMQGIHALPPGTRKRLLISALLAERTVLRECHRDVLLPNDRDVSMNGLLHQALLRPAVQPVHHAMSTVENSGTTSQPLALPSIDAPTSSDVTYNTLATVKKKPMSRATLLQEDAEEIINKPVTVESDACFTDSDSDTDMTTNTNIHSVDKMSRTRHRDIAANTLVSPLLVPSVYMNTGRCFDAAALREWSHKMSKPADWRATTPQHKNVHSTSTTLQLQLQQLSHPSTPMQSLSMKLPIRISTQLSPKSSPSSYSAHQHDVSLTSIVSTINESTSTHPTVHTQHPLDSKLILHAMSMRQKAPNTITGLMDALRTDNDHEIFAAALAVAPRLIRSAACNATTASDLVYMCPLLLRQLLVLEDRFAMPDFTTWLLSSMVSMTVCVGPVACRTLWSLFYSNEISEALRCMILDVLVLSAKELSGTEPAIIPQTPWEALLQQWESEQVTATNRHQQSLPVALQHGVLNKQSPTHGATDTTTTTPPTNDTLVFDSNCNPNMFGDIASMWFIQPLLKGVVATDSIMDHNSSPTSHAATVALLAADEADLATLISGQAFQSRSGPHISLHGHQQDSILLAQALRSVAVFLELTGLHTTALHTCTATLAVAWLLRDNKHADVRRASLICFAACIAAVQRHKLLDSPSILARCDPVTAERMNGPLLPNSNILAGISRADSSSNSMLATTTTSTSSEVKKNLIHTISSTDIAASSESQTAGATTYETDGTESGTDTNITYNTNHIGELRGVSKTMTTQQQLGRTSQLLQTPSMELGEGGRHNRIRDTLLLTQSSVRQQPTITTDSVNGCEPPPIVWDDVCEIASHLQSIASNDNDDECRALATTMLANTILQDMVLGPLQDLTGMLQ
jgi:hypothetical protein